MKIAVVFPGFSPFITGGAGSLLLHLCDELIKKGNEVTLITTEIGETWKPLTPSKLKVITVGISTKTSNRDFGILLQIYDVARMYKYLDNSFDLINIHNYPSPLAILLAKKLKRLNIPVVYQCNEPPRFIYDLYHETVKNLSILKKIGAVVTSPFFRMIDKWSVKNIDKIITISTFMQKHIKEIYGRDSTFVMPGIEIDRFRLNIDGSKIRNRFADKKDFFILTSNILHIRKRIDILIEAIPFVLKKYKNIKVIITGDGPEKTMLENLIKELNLQKNVFLTSFVPIEDLPKYYAACDVFAFTAVREPQGGSYAEALASGKPVIVPDEGAPVESIIEGKTGFVFKSLDSQDLAKKIIWCIENKHYLKKMSKDCRKWIEENRTWEKMTKETLEVFNRSVNKKGKRWEKFKNI